MSASQCILYMTYFIRRPSLGLPGLTAKQQAIKTLNYIYGLRVVICTFNPYDSDTLWFMSFEFK